MRLSPKGMHLNGLNQLLLYAGNINSFEVNINTETNKARILLQTSKETGLIRTYIKVSI